MTSTPGSSAAARTLARELIEHEVTATPDTAALGGALSRVYARASGNLRRSVGEDGYSALLDRAVARMHADQPALGDLRLVNAEGVQPAAVTTAIDRQGADAVRAAFESLLTALVEILSDLIGADMVRNLLEHDETFHAAVRRRTP